MKNKIIKTIMALMLGGSTFAAEEGFPISSISTSPPTWHLSVRGALEEHNQLRFDRSEAFEQTVGKQKFAEDLKQLLKIHTKGKEFSKVAVVQPLLKLINPNMIVSQVEKLEGGFVSGQLYRVKAINSKAEQNKVFYIKYLRTKPILVSKGRTYGEEANLHYLAHASHLKDIQQHIDIVLPLASYEYYVKKDERKVFMILPSAEGESFSRLIQNNNMNTINDAFVALGSALGKVHLSYQVFSGINGAKTPKTKQDFINVCVPSHGDLHGDNVFYNPMTKRITFIDVETMANSFDEKDQANSPLCYDMLYMLLMSSKKFGEFMPKNTWAPLLNMFKSYVGVYPMEQRQGLYEYLSYCLQRTAKIEFVDIFKHFTFNKSFGSIEVKGAETLAKQLLLLKIEHHKQLNIGRDRSKECKDIIEKTYRSKESPTNSPIISARAAESSPRLRAVTAPPSLSPSVPSPKAPAKFPLPVSTVVVVETNKVTLLPLHSKVGIEVNKGMPLNLSPKRRVAPVPKGTSLPVAPKKVGVDVAKVTPLAVSLKGGGVVAAPKVMPSSVAPTGGNPINKGTSLPVTLKEGGAINKVILPYNTSPISSPAQPSNIAALRKRFESLPNPGGGKEAFAKRQ